MRKGIIGLLTMLALSLLFALPASAETYVFDQLYASVEVPESYVVLTPDNLANYAEWLQARGTTSEETANDMVARGVLMQCWNEEGDACFELTATQNEDTLNVFDVNEQSSSYRGRYRLSHYPDNDFISEGYEFSSADWKNTENGRFLILKYVYRENGQLDHRGLMRRTIRNGYEITFDMQVYGRSVTNKDNSNLNKIWESFKFIKIQPLPAAASAKIDITEAPPQETNDAEFSFAGTAAKGVTFTAVIMGLNYPDPILSSVEVGSSGKFDLPLKLPKEGAFVVTISAEYNGEDVMDLAYSVKYQSTLLTVNVTTEVPEAVSSDTLTLRGTSTPGALIQAFVNDESVSRKKVAANGKFSIELDTSEEGVYQVVLAFSKSGLADRRITYTFTRQWSQEDMVKALKNQAIKPGYATLVKKIEGYDGHIMGYKCYVVDISQSGDEWIIKMALTKKSKGYDNIIMVVTDSQPEATVDSRVMMYGTCVGMSVSTNETTGETTESYPTFELLLLSDL